LIRPTINVAVTALVGCGCLALSQFAFDDYWKKLGMTIDGAVHPPPYSAAALVPVSARPPPHSVPKLD